MNFVSQPGVLRLLLVAFVIGGSGCARVPPLRPYDTHPDKFDWLAPLVVVGVAEGDKPIGPRVVWPHDPNFWYRLHRVTVHVENILRGTTANRDLTVYRFAEYYLTEDWGGSRRVFWLREESGVYRTTIDGRGSTILVRSGAHPGYKPVPNEPFFQTLDDILLTRGIGPVDEREYAKAVRGGGIGYDNGALTSYLIEKLRHIALTEPPEVRLAACLNLWSYGTSTIAAPLRERARDSVSAAGCTCGEVPSNLNAGQSVACQ
jgi:hypothetical protein